MPDFRTPLSAAPATNLAEVTPNDSADLDNPTRALFVGTAGTLKVTTVGGNTVTFAAITAGWHPIAVTRIFDTGTDADNIMAAW